MPKDAVVPLQMPEKEFVLKIKEHEYKITYPTAGQFIDIETRKISFASSQYDGLMLSGTAESFRAKLMIDMAATYDILIPNLKKDFTIKSIFSLDMIQIHVFLDAYIKQFLVWHKKWMEYIDQLKNDEEEAD